MKARAIHTSQTLPDSFMAKLAKIEALARSGVDGERATAKRLLQALCQKHGVSPEKLATPQETTVLLKFRGSTERTLLKQIIVHVFGTHQVRHRFKPTTCLVLGTVAQCVAVEECWQHYRQQWRRVSSDALETLVEALIHKHKLYCAETSSDSANGAMSPARLARLMAMMQSLDTEEWARRLRLAGGDR